LPALSIPLCAADPSAREKELTYLRTIMGVDLLPYAHLEVPAVENVVILGSGADQHLGLRLFPSQKKLNGGIRAEVSVNYPCKQGDTVRCAWRFMVPDGFKSDAPRNRWWIFGQWHDQPDKIVARAGTALLPKVRPCCSGSASCRAASASVFSMARRRPEHAERIPELSQDRHVSPPRDPDR